MTRAQNLDPIESRVADCLAEYIFTGRLIDKHDVQYYRCRDTGFIQTEEPYWLDEAYSDVIANADSGLLSRCYSFRTIAALLVGDNFPKLNRMLDFGGGYGVFTRLMRDIGIPAFHHDPMCSNLFAHGFDTGLSGQFDLITAFEVFEHLPNPRTTVKELMSHTDTLFFSTVLQPNKQLKSIEDWHYFLPGTGQHISFFNQESLRRLAAENDATLFTNGSTLHAISRVKLKFGAAQTGPLSRVRRAWFRATH
ncbi:class I SAM-dependent methyltransferase [Stieleria sp. JC731]|uniref:class I SAM-dependent methyltransferase n=1 Tax=Pirellulaceae TaxID=2691357 RepID=UPI001E372FFF|nr:class I SAM-dependent methyltransferase [Stieleria sp. JC731]MCC9601109.1 class I SAM-dependent methyltransferase [Stieleria sp. JC731]